MWLVGGAPLTLASQQVGHVLIVPIKSLKIFLARSVFILKAKSNFTLLLYIPFLGIGEWYFKCV